MSYFHTCLVAVCSLFSLMLIMTWLGIPVTQTKTGNNTISISTVPVQLLFINFNLTHVTASLPV